MCTCTCVCVCGSRCMYICTPICICICGLSQNDNCREHSRGKQEKAKMGTSGEAKVSGSLGFNPLQSNPLKTFLPGLDERSAESADLGRGLLVIVRLYYIIFPQLIFIHIHQLFRILYTLF